MRKIFAIALLLALSACNGQSLDGDKFLSSLADTGPDSDPMLNAAHKAEKRGDFAAAAQSYQQMLEKQPANPEITLALADAERMSGNLDQSMLLYDGLLKQNPGNIGAKEGKGLALLARGDFNTPIPLFDAVTKADPKRWKSLNAVGVLFAARNMQGQAQSYFKAALAQNPANPTVLNNLALSEALEQNYNPAIEELQHASTLIDADNPNRKRITLNLALVYAAANRLAEAKSIAQLYYSGAALDNNMGVYAHIAKDNELARTYFNMALNADKNFYAKAWDNLQMVDNSATVIPVAAAPLAHQGSVKNMASQ